MQYCHHPLPGGQKRNTFVYIPLQNLSKAGFMRLDLIVRLRCRQATKWQGTDLTSQLALVLIYWLTWDHAQESTKPTQTHRETICIGSTADCNCSEERKRKQASKSRQENKICFLSMPTVSSKVTIWCGGVLVIAVFYTILSTSF